MVSHLLGVWTKRLSDVTQNSHIFPGETDRDLLTGCQAIYWEFVQRQQVLLRRLLGQKHKLIGVRQIEQRTAT